MPPASRVSVPPLNTSVSLAKPPAKTKAAPPEATLVSVTVPPCSTSSVSPLPANTLFAEAAQALTPDAVSSTTAEPLTAEPPNEFAPKLDPPLASTSKPPRSSAAPDAMPLLSTTTMAPESIVVDAAVPSPSTTWMPPLCTVVDEAIESDPTSWMPPLPTVVSVALPRKSRNLGAAAADDGAAGHSLAADEHGAAVADAGRAGVAKAADRQVAAARHRRAERAAAVEQHGAERGHVGYCRIDVDGHAAADGDSGAAGRAEQIYFGPAAAFDDVAGGHAPADIQVSAQFDGRGHVGTAGDVLVAAAADDGAAHRAAEHVKAAARTDRRDVGSAARKHVQRCRAHRLAARGGAEARRHPGFASTTALPLIEWPPDEIVSEPLPPGRITSRPPPR